MCYTKSVIRQNKSWPIFFSEHRSIDDSTVSNCPRVFLWYDVILKAITCYTRETKCRWYTLTYKRIRWIKSSLERRAQFPGDIISVCVYWFGHAMLSNARLVWIVANRWPANHPKTRTTYLVQGQLLEKCLLVSSYITSPAHRIHFTGNRNACCM